MDRRRWWSVGVTVMVLTLCAVTAWAEKKVRVMIKFHSHPNVNVVKDAGGVVHVVISGSKRCVATLPASAIARLRAHASVEFVEPDVQIDCHGPHPGEPPPPPTPPGQTLPTGVDRVEGDVSSAQSGNGSGTTDVDVAVIDTGIDLDHSELNVIQNVNCLGTGANGDDDFGHGSHVAGIVGARDDATGVVGLAPGARLWAVKSLDRTGTGWVSTVAAGLDYVTQNSGEIEVVALAAGFRGTSVILSAALSSCVAAGVTVVVPAGNDATLANYYTPANLNDVIAVSAIVDTDGRPGGLGASSVDGNDDAFAAFSNYGGCVDLAAPGVDIRSTWMNGGYNTVSGSSSAASHVAGVVALYLSSHPGTPPQAVLQTLQAAGFAQGSAGGFSGDPDSTPERLVNAAGF